MTAASHALQTYVAERTEIDAAQQLAVGDIVTNGDWHSGTITQFNPDRSMAGVRYQAWAGHGEPTRWDWFKVAELRKRT